MQKYRPHIGLQVHTMQIPRKGADTSCGGRSDTGKGNELFYLTWKHSL